MPGLRGACRTIRGYEMSSNYTSFSKDTWDQFKADQRPGPIHMLNLIRLREIADYPDGRSCSGLEAYKTYSDLSAPVFQRLGGRIVWRGGHKLTMIGPEDEAWDIAFVAKYPSVEAFMAMVKNPAYRDAMRHRQAGVCDSRLVRFFASETGERFLA